MLPTKNPTNGIKHEEPPSLDKRIDIRPEACLTVNMGEGYDNSSTQAVLEAVEVKGKHTLSLGGKDVISHSSKNQYTNIKKTCIIQQPGRILYRNEICRDDRDNYLSYRFYSTCEVCCKSSHGA